MQSRKGSFVEAVVNTLIGFLFTLAFTPLIYWICGVTMRPAQMGYVTLLFTLVSVLRGYLIRRFFNKRFVNNHEQYRNQKGTIQTKA